MRKLLYALLILALVYASVGLALHLKWKSDQKVCRELRASEGEFVEPFEVYGGLIGLVFDVTAWPVYTWANIYHFGTPFPPCPASKNR